MIDDTVKHQHIEITDAYYDPVTGERVNPLTNAEINEAVARELGLKLRKVVATGEVVWKREIESGFADIDYAQLPAYSTDIKAAWEIVEHIQKHGMGWLNFNLESWVFAFRENVDGKPSDEISAKADTAPLAICQAFLKLP